MKITKMENAVEEKKLYYKDLKPDTPFTMGNGNALRIKTEKGHIGFFRDNSVEMFTSSAHRNEEVKLADVDIKWRVL